jgi:glycine cleavage system transcriptional repressor
MIIITAAGRDHPGMAHALAQILSDSGCNIEDTTMTRLSGEFAMILIVSPPDGEEHARFIQNLETQLAPLESSHGLFVGVRDIDDTRPELADAPRYILSVYGPEKTGLLAAMTGVLAQHGVNITDVQTRVAGGGAVYVMMFELELPQGLGEETLQTAIQNAAQSSGLQASLRQLEEETL